MKITCVTSLAPGTQKPSEKSQIEEVNLDDDSSNESGVVILNSVESPDQKSSDDLYTPLSPEPEKVRIVLPETPLSPNIDYESSKIVTKMLENAVPIQILLDRESCTGPPADTPAVVLESPESPTPSNEAITSSQFMKVRFEVGDEGSGGAFTLDNQGEWSVGVSKPEGKDDDDIEILEPSCSSTTAASVMGCGSRLERQKQKRLYSVDDKIVLDIQSTGAAGASDNENKAGSAPLRIPNRSCFNCLGPHTLRDCPEILDQSRINRRRREFKAVVGDNTRYHEQTLETKYNHFKPGVLSEPLKTAMGLRKNQLPEHVYNMRRYGYPPGWFRHAAEAASGLKFYGSDTVRLAKSKSQALQSFKEKLINFPGFTAPVPEGYKDESRVYGIGYNPDHTMENMALKWWQEQVSEQEKREILTAHRKTTQRPSATATTSSNAEALDASREMDSGPIWYESLCEPRVSKKSQPKTSDVDTVEQIYQRMVQGKVIPPNRDWTDMEYDGGTPLLCGPRNYRMTREIERREEERMKQETSKKLAEENWKKREGEMDESPSSPSLLDTFYTPTKFNKTATPSKNACEDVTQEDDDVMIVEDSYEPDKNATIAKNDSTPIKNIKKRPPKRPASSDAEVIVLDSDDEDGETFKKGDNYLPNPLFKKPKLSADNSKDAGDLVKRPSKLPSSSTVISEQKMPDWLLEEDTPAAGQSGRQKGTSSAEKPVANEDLLRILVKHNDENSTTSYSDLPPMDNFSKGMPDLPLQDEAIQFTGRLKKVLGIIQDKKANQQQIEDDDIQIIE